MNGAVETRSNWKGLNAGLREVATSAAMSFAWGWKVKVCGTRAVRLYACGGEDARKRFDARRVPSNRHCRQNE